MPLFASPPFVAIEGLDGAGTTTQSELLVERLRDAEQPAHLTREPSDGPIGALIRQMLSERVVTPRPDGGHEAVDREVLALLFAADRLDHLRAEVETQLADGRVVVSDRYYHSSFAYQADGEEGEPPDLQWVRRLNERARRPDLTIYLEASAELCLERMRERGRRDIFEDEETLQRLEARYEYVIEALETEGEPILRVDADQPPEVLADRIFEAVCQLRE